jgi:hypothetical protein
VSAPARPRAIPAFEILELVRGIDQPRITGAPGYAVCESGAPAQS